MSLSIDWAYWRNMRTVKLWQACALVLGLEPDRLKPHPQQWMAGAGAGRIFEDRNFPNLEIKERFGKALRLAENAVSYMDGPIYPQGIAHPGNKQEKDVLLSEVVAFFVACDWADIPELLQSIAQPAAPVVEAPASETAEKRRARWLAMFESEEKVCKRGALQRVADSEGVDRSNMSKDIEKARAIRTEQSRAGLFVSQLVRDGKRKG